MNIILMGPPGVGKGTQSRRLAVSLNIPIVASGDMFRAMRERDEPLAREVRRYMDRGEYVPDDLTIELVLSRLRQPDAHDGFILDGFPRTVPQAEALDEALAKDNQKIDHVIVLEAPRDIVTGRLSGRWICSQCGQVFNENSRPPRVAGFCDNCGSGLVQRTDEAPGVQSHRLEVFAAKTEPVVDYYRKSDRVEFLDAQQTVDAVERALQQIIGVQSSA